MSENITYKVDGAEYNLGRKVSRLYLLTGIEATVEECALDFYTIVLNDIHKDKWPLPFELIHGGESIGFFEVDLDREPVFSVRKKDSAEQG